MPTRAEKEARVDSLKQELTGAPLVALVDYTTITVEQVNSVRRTFESKGLTYRVEKNTLIDRAVQDTEKSGLN
jgi:large subunit ribosomal protein L10